MKVCVLLPSYEGSEVDYQRYDPPRDLTALLPGHAVHHEFLRKATTFRQIRDLRAQRFDIFVNLCEGYLDWDIPSVDVIQALEHFNLPYTGPTVPLYTVAKDVMKQVASAGDVRYPRFALATQVSDVATALRTLSFPMFVKPNAAGDSLGIQADARVTDPEELTERVEALLREHDEVLIEEFIEGREFTVLVLANPEAPANPWVLEPIEFVFPPDTTFKTYDLKVRQYHPEANRPCADSQLAARIRELGRRIFVGFQAAGYARIDVRMDATGELYFLEANFTCGIFYPEGYYGSADYILQVNGVEPARFLNQMIAEGQARHRARRRRYAVRPCASGGFGIFATEALHVGTVVYRGEERAQRLATLGHVERHWDAEALELFRRYAYPAGPDIHIIWPAEPSEWAPQNHSCEPNTAFQGLNVIALREIREGEELTVDYATFCGADMPEFICHCGAKTCRGLIHGGGPRG